MIEAYIDLTLSNPIYRSSTEGAFLRYLDFTENEENSDLLRKSLLKKIQENQGNPILTDLLIWYFYQIKNFNGAFTQLKALAKRESINNDEFLAFARICSQNGAYKEANMAYDYLAKINYTDKLDAEKALSYFKELESTPNPDDILISRSSEAFKTALNDPIKKQLNAYLYLSFSDFELKYKQNLDSAIYYLDALINANIGDQLKGTAKLKKGDILLIQNDIWEAALLYGQVDKAFKNDVLGFEAKFRNAKIAYFTGDFEWAKAQLNILKRATAKLISNDAIKLSLLITDNLNQDTTGEALSEYAQAELLTFQNKFEASLSKLDSISFKYPGNSLADEILYEQYEIALKQKNYPLAEEKLLQITQSYSSDLFGDNAYYYLGLLYEGPLNMPEKASLMYETLLQNFPGSLFVIDARKRFRQIRGDI